MKMKTKMNNKGFSLLEISIVLAIVGIITVGFIQGNLLLLKKNRTSGTKKKLEVIEKALINYLLVNGDLPCPAGLSFVEGDGNFGVEDIDCTGTGLYTGSDTNFIGGAIPTSTLNIANEMMKDEWGNKFSYVVDKRFTTNTGFELQNPEATSITVYTEGVSDIITTKAIYSIVSHGENKLGGYSYSSGLPTSTTGISTEEGRNIIESTFNITNVYTKYAENFDDIVRYKTKNQLIMDLDWEEIGCYIDMAILNAKEPDALCDDLLSDPASTYLTYYEEFGEDNEDWTYNTDDQTNCCIAKCYKYGRVGYFLKGSDCD